MPERGSRRSEPREPPNAPAAVEIAVHFLGTRPRTRWEIARRLRRSAADEIVIEATLEHLTKLGYVDDAAFARWWGEQRDRHAPRGLRLIEAELRQHGVPREVIEAYRDEHAMPDRVTEDEHLPGDDRERAEQALAKHLRGRPLPTEAKALQRIGMFLMRRGFDPETVRATIRAAGEARMDDALED
jgi:regulatory protein